MPEFKDRWISTLILLLLIPLAIGGGCLIGMADGIRDVSSAIRACWRCIWTRRDR